MDFTYQKPEKRYAQADDEERRRWLEEDLPRIKEVATRHHAVLYFEDECSVSLTPMLGKTWVPRGQTPVQKVTGTRGSISAMSAISKSGRLIFSLYEKRIASDEVIHFLSEMLSHHKRRHIVVVMDQASPHTSKKTKAFVSGQKRLHVFYLPPYSPDFSPDEYVWNHLKNEELKGHQARTKVQLKQLAQEKLQGMSDNRKLLKGLFFRCVVAELL